MLGARDENLYPTGGQMVGGEGLTEGLRRGHGQWVTWARSARGVLHGLTGGSTRGTAGQSTVLQEIAVHKKCKKGDFLHFS